MEVKFIKEVHDDLNSFETETALFLISEIERKLSDSPLTRKDVHMLKNSEYEAYRLKLKYPEQGVDHRAIFDYDDENYEITVVMIGDRDNVYDLESKETVKQRLKSLTENL